MVHNCRYGCVLLAGDAAHVHSPAGGQGHEHRLESGHGPRRRP
ncbi:FAD-dependent monooxygenase [Nonomuraea insulae]|uniref:FAD-dependent monooxygenase n=1 Tax=Nonomuraea insulae TaxID=1616787 RepID=A0ABW1CNR7_9ACTN